MIIAAVIVAALSYAVLKNEYDAKTPDTGEKTITVTVTHDGVSSAKEIRTEADNLLDALTGAGLIATAPDDENYITEVDGVAADTARAQWWQIYKDGKMVSEPAGKVALKDGDSYEFVLAGPETVQ